MVVEQADLTLLARGGREVSAESKSCVPLPRIRWKTRFLIPGGLLCAAALVLVYTARDALLPAAEVRVVPVVVKSGVGGGAGAVVQAPGWVEADPYAMAVSALADGVVKEVLVLEGEVVEAGQVVARLVDNEARLAVGKGEAELAQREAHVLAARAALAAAQGAWDNPVELTRKVAEAEARLAERQAELERWPAELAAAEAKLVELQAEYEQVARVHEQGQASEIEFIRARQQYEGQRATVEVTRGQRAILEAQLAAARADAQAARDDLRLRIPERRALDEARAVLAEGEAAVELARTMLAEARLRLERMEVRAPAAGVVMARLVAPGSKVMLGGDSPHSAQVLRLYDPKKLQVRVDVPLAEAARVGVGQRAEVVVYVLPDRVFHGRVTRVVHEADIQRNTLQMKVAIGDPSPELKPEMLARVRFVGPAPGVNGGAGDSAVGEERVFALEALVRRDAGGGTCVWVVDRTRGLAELRSVVLGETRAGRWVEVREGLRPGDRLIATVGGQEAHAARLRAGQRVRIAGEEYEGAAGRSEGQ